MEDREAWLRYLFVNGAAFSEHNVSTQHASNEGVPAPFLASVRALLEQQKRLVQRDELGEVQRMCLRRAEDGAQSAWPATRMKNILSAFLKSFVGVTYSTHSPRPNSIAIMSAWGNRTLTPYTSPLRAPLRMAR